MFMFSFKSEDSMGATEEDITAGDDYASEFGRAYLRDALGDPFPALREVIRDGLAERRHARLREVVQAQAISHGYVRRRGFGPTS